MLYADSTNQTKQRTVQAAYDWFWNGSRKSPKLSEKPQRNQNHCADLHDVTATGERMDTASAKNRLQVALATLRKRGLKGLLVFDEEAGYQLTAEVPHVVVSAG